MKIKLLLVFLLFAVGIQAQIVNIPDANFKAKLLSSSPSNTVAKDLNGNYFAIDANGDGEIEQNEAIMVKELEFTNVNDYSTNPIYNYQGISSFTSLEILKLSGELDGYSSAELDLSNHPALKKVDIQNLGLPNLNLSHCNLLNTVNINMSYSGSGSSMIPNYFGFLDVSYCPFFTTLNINEGISGLKANGCSNLQSLPLSFKSIGNLQTNDCPLLTSIELMGNHQIAMANCPNLKDIKIARYTGTSFDATNAVNLENLELGYYEYYSGGGYNFMGDLQNLTVNNNLQLKTLSVNNHKMTQLNINGLSKLQSLSITADNYHPNYSPQPNFATEFLQSVNIQNCPLLTTVSFAQQQGLKTVSIKNCPSLQQFNHENSTSANSSLWSLQSLDIEDCAALNSINVSYNQLTSLKIHNCPTLQTLDVKHNKLTTFDLLNNNDLKNIDISNNQFINLPSLNFSALETLNAYYNKIMAFDINAPLLKKAYLFSNNLVSFNIHNYSQLEELEIGANKIEDLDVSNHHKLHTLWSWIDSGWGQPPLNSGTYLKTVNANNCTNLDDITLISTVLDKVFIKNGKVDNLNIFDSPNLQFICCDANEVSTIQNNFPNVTVTSDCNIGPVLSTAENSLNPATIKVHPNPTKGDVTITADSKIKSVEVYDAQGRIIQKQMGINSQEAKVSIHSSTSGMYIFKITTEKEVISKKVIKN